MTRTRTNPIPLLILALAVIAVAWIIIQQHAVESHGDLALGARSQFERCDQLPGAELYSLKRDRWAYLCFPDLMHMAVQILTDQRGNPESREITTIPAEHISKPYNYIRTLFERDGYTIKATWGEVPTWFEAWLP